MIEKCQCGSNKDVDKCCNLIISGVCSAETPEQLMRSRYTAYTQANIDYIEKSMSGNAAKNFNASTIRDWAQSVTWLGLAVKKAFLDEKEPNKGFVEFEATFKDKTGNVQKIRELSEFTQIDKTWFYTDGKTSAKSTNSVYNKLRRNETCTCGSGKKFKKCCYLN